MLIYCTTLWLENPTTLQDVQSVIAGWLTWRTREIVPAGWLRSPCNRPLNDGGRLIVSMTESGSPQLYAMRYTHGDQEVSGRQWITEIGVREEDAHPTQVSILVRTSEISARVSLEAVVTRPRVVQELLRRCDVSVQTCGVAVKALTLAELERFIDGVHSPQRTFPFVVISPGPDGNYAVEPERVLDQLGGLADVYQIPVGEDTFAMADRAGGENIAWRGGMRVIFPQITLDEHTFNPSRLFKLDELLAYNTPDKTIERELLSLITHKMNLPNSRRHITPEHVQEETRRRRLEGQLAKLRGELLLTDEQKQYIDLLQEDSAQRDAQLAQVKMECESLYAELQQVEDRSAEQSDEVRQLRHELEQWKAALGSNNSTKDNGPWTGAQVFDALTIDPPAPFEALKIMGLLFEDEVVILPSAFDAAKESRQFKYREEALRLLWTLATEYRDALIESGDVAAREAFGASEYSAHESETVENTAGARRKRTFVYNGQDVYMARHLKIGIKDSAAETLRIHFHWDADAKKIVIGHCGPHLDFK